MIGALYIYIVYTELFPRRIIVNEKRFLSMMCSYSPFPKSVGLIQSYYGKQNFLLLRRMKDLASLQVHATLLSHVRFIFKV